MWGIIGGLWGIIGGKEGLIRFNVTWDSLMLLRII